LPLIVKQGLPEVGELVVATVKEVFDYGAYVELDEYGGLRAYIPWSEVTSKWVRDIREVLRENQKVVAKVIRVNKSKGYVDLSIKRTLESERKKKLLEFKRKQKAEKILEAAAAKVGASLDEAREVWKALEEHYGEVMHAFERAALEGEGVLRAAGVPERWVKHLMDVVAKHVTVERAEVEGVFVVRSFRPDGVNAVKKVLEAAVAAAKSAAGDGVEVKVYAIGSPRYKIEVVANDYKTAEKALAKAVSEAESVAKKEGAEVKFQRLEKK